MRKNNLLIKIATGFACYCMDSIGAVIVLILARNSGDKVTAFHGAQAMLFYLFSSFAQMFLRTMHLSNFFTYQIFNLMQIAFVVFGVYNLLNNKVFKVPFIGDIAVNWV
ncbi:hypothetical protein ACSW8S_18830 (plasmid) [Clostridium perfringens]